MSRSNPLVLADLMGPFKRGYLVTPDNDDPLPNGPARGLYIGVSGNLSFVDAYGTEFTGYPVQAGVFPFEVLQIKATGTTADKIIAGY